MRIVIVRDSFKGSLSTKEVALAVADGIKRVDKNAEIVTLPLADGGEKK